MGTAYDGQFLTEDKRVSEALSAAVQKGCAVGVGDHSTAAMHKAQHGRRVRLDDALLKSSYVTQIAHDATIAAIRAIHKGGSLPELPDTLTLRKAVRLPPQSDNATDPGAPAGRAGAVADLSGYQDPAWPTKRPSQTAPSQASSMRSRSALPTDTDDKERPLRAKPDMDDSDKSGPLGGDPTVKWIRRAHKSPPKVGF